jgi:hypothetical protein
MRADDVRFLGKFEPLVPERYKRIAIEVASRLPEGWDEHAEWSVEVGSNEHPKGYASVMRDEEGAGDTCTTYWIQIYPSLMDDLSDSACRWVFAHEFAHIASKLSMGSIVIKGEPYTRTHGNEYVKASPENVHEDAADKIALNWGFDCELMSFLADRP